jgi:iron complex outermembrane receptor protein
MYSGAVYKSRTRRRVALSGLLAAFAGMAVHPVAAQEAVELPPISVTASRLGSGITGSSTSVITAADIEHSPAQNLPDILAQQTGVQVMHVAASPTGINDMVDLRGFGAFASSNVLVLVNGRRYQDLDLQGFDFSTIPLNSIERIEITRGNSGTVLYGDGAIGGVINIVTKTAQQPGTKGRIESSVGSYGFYEGRWSASTATGPWSISTYGNANTSDGYRQNSQSNQQNSITNLDYKTLGWSSYLNVGLDNQRDGLPGGLPNLNTTYPNTINDPRSSNTPYDWAKKQDVNVTGGFTRTIASGVDLIVDGGVRRKFQQGQYYNYFNNPFFTYDPTTAGPSSYVDTTMTTTSFTPRLDMSNQLFGMPNRLLTGIDVYNTQYGSDRPVQPGTTPVHSYNIRQTTVGIYGMNTTSVLSNVDVSFGGRLQRDIVKGSDIYNASADPNAGFYASNPQAPDVDASEWQYAAHLGYEYRFNPALTLFGRVARGFRLPNADERVGSGNPFATTTPASLDLKTQTSYDIEDGFRMKFGRLSYDTSVYVMYLNNEIHYIPAQFQDINLDPTRRLGWENSASYELSNDVRLNAGVAYTRATFREGRYAGNDIPLVARWSGHAGVSWNIVGPRLVLDVTGRFYGERRMDNDQGNTQPEIPANATVDVKIGGKLDRFFWSLAVQNLFNLQYYDYAIASAFTAGSFSAYPQVGRTYLLQAGMTF